MTHSKYDVRLANRADRMLLAHTEFISRISTSAGRKLLSEFRSAESRLSEDPYLFPFADDLDVPGIPPETYRKCLFYGRYKAIFLIDGSNVFIDAIIDCRQENKGLYN